MTGAKDPSALYDYAYYDLRPRISRIPHVSYVTVQGGDIREIVVEVDPKTLVAANLSIADVADRLGREHRLKAVGRLDQGILQYQVLADTVADAPIDLENVVIVEKNGQPLRVRDLGRVIVSHEDRTKAIRSDGKNAVALTVFRQLGGNALSISNDLNTVLADAQIDSRRDRDHAGLRSGEPGAHGRRQRPRRDPLWRAVQRRRSCCCS